MFDIVFVGLRDPIFGIEALEWRWRFVTRQVVSFKGTHKLDMGVAL